MGLRRRPLSRQATQQKTGIDRKSGIIFKISARGKVCLIYLLSLIGASSTFCIVDDRSSSLKPAGSPPPTNKVDSLLGTQPSGDNDPQVVEGWGAVHDARAVVESIVRKPDSPKLKGKDPKMPNSFRHHPIVDRLRKAGFTVTETSISMTKKMFKWVSNKPSKSGGEHTLIIPTFLWAYSNVIGQLLVKIVAMVPAADHLSRFSPDRRPSHAIVCLLRGWH